jgi:hypothetical protein
LSGPGFDPSTKKEKPKKKKMLLYFGGKYAQMNMCFKNARK